MGSGESFGYYRGHEQARDDSFHPAKAVFLVDSDCLPSESLLDELHSEEVQGRINNNNRVTTRNVTELSVSHPAAIVVPCLEFAPGAAVSNGDQVRVKYDVVADASSSSIRKTKESFGELVRKLGERLLRFLSREHSTFFLLCKLSVTTNVGELHQTFHLALAPRPAT